MGWRVLRSVERDPDSVELFGPTVKTKREALDVMAEIAERHPTDVLGRQFRYTVTKVL